MRPVDLDVEHPPGTPAAVEMVGATDTELALNETAAGVLAVIVREWLDTPGKCHTGEQDSAA